VSAIRQFIRWRGYPANPKPAGQGPTAQQLEIIGRLDALTATQRKLVGAAEAAAVQADVALFELERMRPSPLAWGMALALVVSLGFFVATSVARAARSTGLDGQAAALHQTALADELEGGQIVGSLSAIETLPPSQSSNTPTDPKLQTQLFSQISRGVDLLTDANKAEADSVSIQSEATHSQTLAQLDIALGSAFLGGMLSWMLSQLMAATKGRLIIADSTVTSP
jgi:hypothetical protein